MRAKLKVANCNRRGNIGNVTMDAMIKSNVKGWYHPVWL
jgi:hypothetical protein